MSLLLFFWASLAGLGFSPISFHGKPLPEPLCYAISLILLIWLPVSSRSLWLHATNTEPYQIKWRGFIDKTSGAHSIKKKIEVTHLGMGRNKSCFRRLDVWTIRRGLIVETTWTRHPTGINVPNHLWPPVNVINILRMEVSWPNLGHERYLGWVMEFDI